MSPDTALCFFRVLQEAPYNSAKYSGVRRFEVRLWGTSDEIHLAIVDSSAGFDREAAKASTGLGLISMEERLKILKGTLSIESQPRRGTTIHVHVALRAEIESMRAARQEERPKSSIAAVYESHRDKNVYHSMFWRTVKRAIAEFLVRAA